MTAVTTSRKLIGVALPLEAINVASAREKSIRTPKSSWTFCGMAATWLVIQHEALRKQVVARLSSAVHQYNPSDG